MLSLVDTSQHVVMFTTSTGENKAAAFPSQRCQLVSCGPGIAIGDYIPTPVAYLHELAVGKIYEFEAYIISKCNVLLTDLSILSAM